MERLSCDMDRRTYLKTGTGAAAGLAFAGCLGGGGGDSGSEGGETTTVTQETAGSASEVIAIGSDIPYKPFEYKTNEGEIVGFDVDIAEAVFAKQLGYDYDFNQTSFDTIIPSLNNGNFRVIMSAMTITEKRATKVDFSDPYFTAYQTIVVLQNSDITSKADLKGKTVGVQKGTTGEKAAEKLKSEFNGDLTIKHYDQIPAAFSAMSNNQVAAVINDNTVSAEYVNQHPESVRFVEGKGAAANAGKKAPPYLTLTVEEYGIAFRKNDDQLKKKVNGALKTIRENGTYDKIYNEYFAG